MHWKLFTAAAFLMTSLLQSQQADSRPVILAFGDSLTAGYGVPPGLGYPEQLQIKLDAAGYKYRVLNMGISGDTTSGGRARMTRALLAVPAIVILELGGNDKANGLTSNQTKTNLEQIITQFQKERATVVLVARELAGGNDVYAALAAQYHLPLISNFLNGVDGNSDLTIGDLRHPNADGYAIVVTNLMKAIEPLLKK